MRLPYTFPPRYAWPLIIVAFILGHVEI